MGDYRRSIAAGKQSLRQTGTMTRAAEENSEDVYYEWTTPIRTNIESDLNAGDRRRMS
jgi:hypothetical protein